MKDYETKSRIRENEEEKLYSIYVGSFINDYNWMEVPTRTRNGRNLLVLDMQMHLVDHLMNQLHNYIDLVVVVQLMVDLVNLVVD